MDILSFDNTCNYQKYLSGGNNNICTVSFQIKFFHALLYRLTLKISKRTLQTLRDNGTLAYTKIGNRTYYLPEDVERIVTKVEDRRKDARYRGHTI